jgi:excisionase family DNA binding protein
VALLSVRQPDGTWSTLQHGLDTKEGSNDGQLFELVAASASPLEIPDLMGRLPRSALVLPPHSMRWAYGTALRLDATVRGVVVVLDRWLREASKREQRAMVSLSRQLGVQLVEWIRPTATDVDSPVRPFGTTGGTADSTGADTLAPAAGRRGPTGDARGETAPPAGSPLVTNRHNLLRSQEVAEVFDVTERTVINWAAAGKLPSLRTIGGHLRFRREDVLRLVSPAD